MATIPFVFALAFIVLQAKGQNTGDYRSNVIGTGFWSSNLSWERFNGTSWVTPSAAPTSADGVITILSGDRIDLTSTATIDQVVVAAGGQLFLYGLSATAVTLANGAGNDIEVNGQLVVSVNATLSGSGNIVNNSGGTLIVRNTGTLSVQTVNNGLMQVSGTGNFQNTTVTNYATFNLLDFTLNLNNATFTNRGLATFESALDTYVAGTGGGVFINEADGTLFRNQLTTITWIDPAPGSVTFINRGTVKGNGTFLFRSNAINTGLVTPGDNGAGILGVNPAFVTGRSPTFNVDIVSSGFVAGINYDRVVFSNTDFATINISGSTLAVSDNGSDAVGTVYILFNSSSTITGTFATVHLPPTLGNLTYNATSITVEKIATQNRYVWSGGSNAAWSAASSWTPARNTPAVTDVLTFSTGGTITATDVQAQTIAALNITNNTTVNLQALATQKNLTIGNGYMNHLNVNPGSTLTVLDNAGIVLNIFVANGSRASVGGVVNMQSGTFNVGNNVLQLHTTAVPLLRTSGQFAIGSSGSIEFGALQYTSGPAITLSNSIFVGPPVIASVTVCRTNGAVFGNQPVTVNRASMILGNLTTNAAGRILFSTTATNPVEVATSKIIGYAELLSRPVGTTALNFLGAVSAAGSDIGNISITRLTGPAGINTFNGFSSIASTWNITASTEPSPGRNISFSWFSDFDNGANTSFLFQHYRYDVGPGRVAVGGLAALQSSGNPRITTPVITLKLTGSWTVADQANVLPIVMGSFEGKQIDHTIELDWTTLSELRGDYFEVQRRGQDEESFSILGTVSAYGTSNTVRKYSFTDEQPVKGVNYYRLKLVDIDQSFDYSSVIPVTFDPAAQFTVYPNPATGRQVTVQFAEPVNGQLTVFDMAQRKVLSQVISGTPADAVVLNDLALTAGSYLVTFESSGKRVVRKLVVRP